MPKEMLRSGASLSQKRGSNNINSVTLQNTHKPVNIIDNILKKHYQKLLKKSGGDAKVHQRFF